MCLCLRMCVCVFKVGHIPIACRIVEYIKCNFTAFSHMNPTPYYTAAKAVGERCPPLRLHTHRCLGVFGVCIAHFGIDAKRSMGARKILENVPGKRVRNVTCRVTTSTTLRQPASRRNTIRLAGRYTSLSKQLMRRCSFHRLSNLPGIAHNVMYSSYGAAVFGQYFIITGCHMHFLWKYACLQIG